MNGEEQVIMYSSRTLTKAERKYSATRKEMLALVWAIQNFRPYLVGKDFKIRTDHNALRWLFNFKEPEGQIARWIERLAEFTFTIEHRPGQQHTNADSLSRIDHCNQCGETMLDEQANNAISSVSKWVPEWSIDELKAHQSKDPDIKEMINWIQTNTLPKTFPREVSQKLQTLWCQRQQLQIGQDGILYRLWEDVRGRGSNPELQIVLPLEMVFIVLTQLHGSAIAGHLGIRKTLDKVQRCFYWPGQRRDVEDWCRSCSKCIARKLPVRPHHAPMQIETAGKPLQRVSMDILGPLPETKRQNRYILVIGDYFTKWMEALPMSNMEAQTVARLFVNHFVTRFGSPEYLHTDQGRNFESTLVKEVCKILGIEKTRTTPYHPQSNGMVERFNRTLLNMLSTISQEEEDWDRNLPLVMYAYRTSIHETTGATPFSLMFGREARLPIDLMFPPPEAQNDSTPSKYAAELRIRLEQAYHSVRQHMSLRQQRQKELYDKNKTGSPLKIGDKVWLHSTVVPRGKSRKFHCPWSGPFVIVKILSDVVYRIQDVQRPRRRHVVHFDRLKRCSVRPFTQSAVPESFQRDSPSSETTNSTYLPQDILLNGDDDYIISVHQLPESPPSDPLPIRRSNRTTHQPDRYGDLVPH